MSDDEVLAAIRARADAATAGPWSLMSPRPDGRNAVQRPDYNPFTNEASPALLVYDTNPEDAEFIAHAREDVPLLLGRLEALTARVNELEAERDEWMRQAGTATGWWRNEQDARKEAEATLAKVQRLHKPKHGENDRGKYVICDYDGTAWPCRTQVLLDGNGGDTE